MARLTMMSRRERLAIKRALAVMRRRREERDAVNPQFKKGAKG